MDGNEKMTAIAVVAFVIVVGVLGLTEAWNKQDQKRADFVAECNKNDGVARMVDGILNCVRASEAK